MQCGRKPVAYTIDTADSSLTERVMLRDVLRGHLSEKLLRNCSTHCLENILLKVLNLQTGAQGVKPAWWPEDVLPFTDIHVLRYQVNQFIMSWHTALSVILESCVQYYKDRLSIKTPSVLNTLSSSSTEPPANTSLSTTTSSTSIVADARMSPRVVLKDVLSSPKFLEASNLPKTKPSTSTIPSSLWAGANAQIDNSIRPYVVLKDILKCKYPIYDKNDYMGFLKLQPTNTPASVQLPKTIVSNRYPHKIPFSSVCGKKLIQDERYVLNEYRYERKRDWTNRYLREERTPTPSLQTTHSAHLVSAKQRKAKLTHVYKFPRRQQRQHANAVHRLKVAFCRPMEVHLTRMNISPQQLKQLVSKVRVQLDKTEVDQFCNSIKK